LALLKWRSDVVTLEIRGTLLAWRLKRTRGRAFQGGRLVAEVQITETLEVATIAVPRPGSTTLGRKPIERRGPTTIIFEEIYDDGFAGALERLVEAWDDVARKRKMRDDGTSFVGFDLSLMDDRQLPDASVTWPDVGLGLLETISFTLRHSEL